MSKHKVGNKVIVRKYIDEYKGHIFTIEKIKRYRKRDGDFIHIYLRDKNGCSHYPFDPRELKRATLFDRLLAWF